MEIILGTIIVLIIMVALISFIIKEFNRMVALSTYADKAFYNIDVLLKQRADEIPQLVSIVNASTLHEEKTLSQLTEIRSAYLQSHTLNEKVETNNDITEFLQSIFAIIEDYPELTSLSNFQQLQQRVSQLNEAIAQRREFFNESVALFNAAIRSFPNIIFSRLFGFSKKSFLTITIHHKNPLKSKQKEIAIKK